MLYLVEIQLDISKQEEVMARIEQLVKENGTPTSTLVAGPWFSMENPTMWLVAENPDLTKTMPEIISLYENGLIKDTRQRPIIDFEGVKAAAAKAQA